MARAWLSLGANIGNPPAQLAEAVKRLGALMGTTVISQSTVIRTAPWGKTDQPDFANMAIEIETDLGPQALLDACLAIEHEMGRVREEVWGPRLIDIDVIAYEKIRQQSARLTLPHPHAYQREFVLGPLREISPDTADWIVAQH